MLDFYEAGRQATLQELGIVKVAVPLRNAGLFGRTINTIRNKLPSWRTVRRELVGSPLQFLDEISTGRAFSKGSLIRQGFEAPSIATKLMFYGPAAIEAGMILSDDEKNKVKRLGEVAGSTALGFGLYRPLGLAGSILMDPVGRAIGGAVGQTAEYAGKKLYNKAKGIPSTPEKGTPAPNTAAPSPATAASSPRTLPPKPRLPRERLGQTL